MLLVATVNKSDTVLFFVSAMSVFISACLSSIFPLNISESCAVASVLVSSLELLPSSFMPPFLQNKMFQVMRQGMTEMLQFEKKTEEEKKRVYTYEKAVERYL